MPKTLSKALAAYSYNLPPELIAQKPAQPRDAARLLVYNRRNQKTTFDNFGNLAKYLPKNAVLVFNQTRVIPARLPLFKETGGKVEALYISRDQKSIRVLADKKLSPGQKLCLQNPVTIKSGRTLLLPMYFQIKSKTEGFYVLKPSFPMLKINNTFKKFGLTPLPPYMKHSPLSEKQRREAYQTVFAKAGESVAAPTASLHFTSRLINKLKKQGVETKFVRLDVNLGTFAKLTEKQIQTGKLHHEKYFIDKPTAKYITRAKKSGRPIIAVGTTVVRTLESWKKTKRTAGTTDLFIRPGFKFQIIDGLITNFHVPQSSLLMLVSALTGREKLLTLYQSAIEQNLRFFSFGDGMLIL